METSINFFLHVNLQLMKHVLETNAYHCISNSGSMTANLSQENNDTPLCRSLWLVQITWFNKYKWSGFGDFLGFTNTDLGQLHHEGLSFSCLPCTVPPQCGLTTSLTSWCRNIPITKRKAGSPVLHLEVKVADQTSSSRLASGADIQSPG